MALHNRILQVCLSTISVALLSACDSSAITDSSGSSTDNPALTETDSIQPSPAIGGGGDLYLIIGQSNAAGRDTNFNIQEEDAPTSSVKLLNQSGIFVNAQQPLNQYSGLKKDNIEQGVNFGLEFGKTMVAFNDRPVHLVVNARGGTSVAHWRKGKTTGYFDDTVGRVKAAEAACNCKLAGILWHQGEGNVSSEDGTYPNWYFASLTGLIREYRDELGEVPFIVGQIYQDDAARNFNEALKTVDDEDFAEPDVDWVSAINLTTTDGTHFDAESTRKLGDRYARRMQEYVATVDPGTTTPLAFKAAEETVRAYTENEWVDFTATTFPNLEDDGTTVALSKYGGWLKHRHTATGFFRVELIDGRWWAIDPEGYRYIDRSINSVKLDDFTANEVYSLLKDNGFSGLGNWSDEEIVNSSLQDTTPLTHTPKYSFIAEYRRNRTPRIEMPVFDREFIDFAKEQAQVFAVHRNDPTVFGYFSDNELSWTVNGLPKHIEIRDLTDRNYVAAMNFLASRGKTASNYNDADIDAYTELMAEAYFSAVGPAIKAVDPNHMYLGTRLNKSWRRTEGFMQVAGQHLDAVAINHYHRWGSRDVEIRNISEWTGKPVILSEFYAMETDEPEDVKGAGWRVTDQKSRGVFYHNFVTEMAKNQNVVGWHWFKFQDDEDGDKGIVDINGNAYTTLLDWMRPLNFSLYEYTEYLDELENPDVILTPEADAYFQDDTNYGEDTELQVKNASEKFHRETYLRFNLSSLSTSPRSAVITLSSIAEDKEAGAYQAELVTNNIWGERSITAGNNPAGSVVLATWGHGDDVEIDVTDIIRNGQTTDGKLSIRIVSTFNNGSKPVYGSSEHPQVLTRPQLLIHYD